MKAGQEHQITALSMDKVRLNLHRKNIASLHDIRQNNKQKIGGAAYVPIEALMNVTRQQ